MTPEEIKAQARAALDTIADAMSAHYDGDTRWCLKCIETIQSDPQHTRWALQAMVVALVSQGARPRMFRDISVEALEVGPGDPEQK